MNVIEFETIIENKFKFEKVIDFQDLRNFLATSESYPEFTPYEVTEGLIENEDFYAAYIFDEVDVSKRNMFSKNNSGWVTLIVIVSSIDNKNIDDYYVLSSNALTNEEYRKFLNYIDSLILQ